MATELNRAGVAYAKSLIAAGKVDRSSAWSFDAADGDALLGHDGSNWTAYGRAHLAIDTDAGEGTKERFKYPFAKGGNLYRSGLIAVRQRAGQQKDNGVFDAAGALLDVIDKKETKSAMSTLERRFFVADALTVERRAEGKTPLIRGHAAVFGQLSEDLGGFREQIAPGAFAEAIEKDDVRALFNHDPNFILGRNLAGTLRMKEDAKGLAIRIDAPDTQTIRDLVLAPIERGDVTGMSFGFSLRPGGSDWAQNDDGITVRTLKNVRLYDVSPVVYPAYPQTDCAMRELRAWREEIEAEAAAADAPVPMNLIRALQMQAEL